MPRLLHQAWVPAVLLIAPIAVLRAQAPDPLMGTWTLNPAKSTFNLGPPYKSATLTYEPAGQGVKATLTGVFGDGTALTLQYTANFDGKDYPVTGTVSWDAVALTRVSRFTVEQTRKKAGQVVNTARLSLSPDGKTLTVTGKLADGRPGDILVYEK